MFQAVAELMRAVAASVPLYVMLDDFHCADGQWVAVLKHLAMSVEQAPLGGRGHLPMTERGYVAFEPLRSAAIRPTQA